MYARDSCGKRERVASRAHGLYLAARISEGHSEPRRRKPAARCRKQNSVFIPQKSYDIWFVTRTNNLYNVARFGAFQEEF
jgi:hypothetical protein